MTEREKRKKKERKKRKREKKERKQKEQFFVIQIHVLSDVRKVPL